MNYGKWTIENELPESLTKEEQLRYFQEMANGNMKAREELINHNLRLVSHEVLKNFANTKADKNDLFSFGVIGLIKSIDRFDMSKNVEFSTFATKYINGEIMYFIRKEVKIPNVMSIETSIFSTKDGDDVKIIDMLHDDFDFVSEYEKKDIYRIINIIVDNLPPRDREITKLYFGFYDNKPKNQIEIANIIGISQAQVSRILIRIVKQIKLELYKQEILEYSDLTIKEKYKEQEKNKTSSKPQTIYTLFKYYSKTQVNDMLLRLTAEERKLITIRYGEDLEHPVPSEQWNNKNNKNRFNTVYQKMRYLLANPEKVSIPLKKEFIEIKPTLNQTTEVESPVAIKENLIEPIKKGNGRKMTRRLQSIYEYFKFYTREQVDEMLSKLTEEERKLVIIRYGEDLDNPVSGKLTKEQSEKFYGSLVPKMKRLLANPTGERKPRQKKEKVQLIQDQPVVESKSVISETCQLSQEQSESVERELITKTSNLEDIPIESVSTSSDKREMAKEDYIKILELLRTPTFTQMMSVLSVKESVIISLKLGYIDGKYFSTESIARFLGIEEAEVIETTKKILLLYKETISNFIDQAITFTTELGETRQRKF